MFPGAVYRRETQILVIGHFDRAGGAVNAGGIHHRIGRTGVYQRLNILFVITGLGIIWVNGDGHARHQIGAFGAHGPGQREI